MVLVVSIVLPDCPAILLVPVVVSWPGHILFSIAMPQPRNALVITIVACSLVFSSVVLCRSEWRMVATWLMHCLETGLSVEKQLR